MICLFYNWFLPVASTPMMLDSFSNLNGLDPPSDLVLSCCPPTWLPGHAGVMPTLPPASISAPKRHMEDERAK